MNDVRHLVELALGVGSEGRDVTFSTGSCRGETERAQFLTPRGAATRTQEAGKGDGTTTARENSSVAESDLFLSFSDSEQNRTSDSDSGLYQYGPEFRQIQA